MDTAYRVSFFKDITNCYGKLFKMCQRSIVIRSARSPERAIRAAKIRFSRLERIRDWTLRAEKIELDVLPEAAGAQPVRALPQQCVTRKGTAGRRNRQHRDLHR